MYNPSLSFCDLLDYLYNRIDFLNNILVEVDGMASLIEVQKHITNKKDEYMKIMHQPAPIRSIRYSDAKKMYYTYNLLEQLINEYYDRDISHERNRKNIKQD